MLSGNLSPMPSGLLLPAAVARVGWRAQAMTAMILEVFDDIGPPRAGGKVHSSAIGLVVHREDGIDVALRPD